MPKLKSAVIDFLLALDSCISMFVIVEIEGYRARNSIDEVSIVEMSCFS